MAPRLRLSRKQRHRLYFIIMAVGLVAVLVSSNYLYRFKIGHILAKEAESTIQQAQALKSEMLLCAHTMAYSPVLVDYFFSPEDVSKQKLARDSCNMYSLRFMSGRAFWVSDKDLRYYENGEFLYRVFPPSKQDRWYNAAYDEEYCLITEEFDRNSNKPFLRMSIPVYGVDGTKAGVAGAVMSIYDIGELFSPKERKWENLFFLCDAEGRLTSMSRFDSNEEESFFVENLQDCVVNLPLHPSGMIRGSSSMGEFVVAPIGDTWKLLLLYPFSVRTLLYCLAGTFGILIFLLAVVLSIFQTRRYIAENKVIREQKHEIEILNENQSSFFSCMSHEIRTPINTIIGLDEMILREDISDEVAEDARDIAGAGKILLALINDILDMSKLSNGKMEIVLAPYNTGELFSDIVNMMWVRAKAKGLDFQVDIDPAIPSSLMGDEVRIKQVLLNLISNAIKYTKEGTVAFSVRHEESNPGEVMVTYSVEDTGIGVKKESIPYLFDAFKRVDMQKNHMIEGTGLGLSIVKQLVDLMGGRIDVRSIYLKGSTFTVTLSQKIVNSNPVGELNLRTGNPKREVREYTQSFEAPNARVLIVDDNDMNLTVEKKLLRDTKLRVDTVDSGKKALVQTMHVRYHAILLDHLMPEMDGITCLHEIRRQPGGLNRNTPAIVLTANAGHKDQLLYEREGFDGYLTKPVSGSQLEKELLSVLPEDLVTLHGDGANIMNIRDVGSTRRLSSKKKPIIITTDFECDLPAQQLRNLGIPVISGKIITDEGTFRSDIEIDTDAVLAYMEEPGHILKTEEPTVAEYEEFFARQLQDYQYIIHISMSSHVGVSFNHAMEASKSFDNITVVDSGLVSSGMGLMVLNARQFSKETMSPQLVLKKIEESKSLFSTSFVVESLDYLESNGIISHLAKSLCRSLLMHPVVKFHKGYMKVARMEFGEVEKARSKYIRACLGNPSRIDDSILYITYSGLSFQELESIKAQALKLVPFKQVHIQKTAPSVACNCGPGAFGLLFKKKGV